MFETGKVGIAVMAKRAFVFLVSGWKARRSAWKNSSAGEMGVVRWTVLA